MSLRCLPLFLIVLLAFAGGCANPWQKSFVPNPDQERKFPPAQQVEVRVVEFARLQNYENAERRERIQSSTSPADFTAEQRRAAKNRLLEALQLKERGDAIEILGWSRFVDSEAHDPRDPALLKLAAEKGADVVVASVGYVGQTSRMVDYPLTSYSNYYTTGVGRGRRSALWSTGGYETTWVPATVVEKQYVHEAVFLRRGGGASH